MPFLTNACLLLLVSLVPPQDEKPERPYVVGESYPLATCIVSGEPLGSMGEVVEKEVRGRKVKLCCEGCVKAVEEAPEKILEKLDQAIVAHQRPNYPLNHCVIMKQKELGSMGEPVELILDGRLVRLCCKGCTKRATRDQEKVLAMVLDAAYEAQRLTYPLETCVVSGRKLGEKPVDYLHGNTLLRLCCKGCLAKAKAKPQQFADLVEKARAEAKEKEKK